MKSMKFNQLMKKFIVQHRLTVSKNDYFHQLPT